MWCCRSGWRTACRACAQEQRTPPSRFDSLSSSPARGARKACTLLTYPHYSATMFLQLIRYIEYMERRRITRDNGKKRVHSIPGSMTSAGTWAHAQTRTAVVQINPCCLIGKQAAWPPSAPRRPQLQTPASAPPLCLCKNCTKPCRDAKTSMHYIDRDLTFQPVDASAHKMHACERVRAASSAAQRAGAHKQDICSS
jgi:hypothetical protein